MGLLSANEDGSRPGVVAVGLGLLPITVILAFGMCLAFGVSQAHMLNLALALVTGAIASIPTILDQGRPAKQRHIILALVSLAWGLYYVLPVFTRYFMVGGYDPTAITAMTAATPRELLNGQLVALLGLLMMLVGYSMPLTRPLTSILPTPRHEWSHGACLSVAIVVIPLGWTIYLGGQFGLVPKRAGTGVLGVLAGSTIYGIALLTLTYMKYRSRAAMVLLVGTIPPTMAFNFFTGSKGLFFAPLAVVLATSILVHRKIAVRWVVVGVTAIALFYPIAQFYREVVQEGNTKGAVAVLQSPGDALRRVSAFTADADLGKYFVAGLEMTSARFSAISITSFIVRDTPSKVPYQGGWSIGYIFLSYVPRVFWPGKPDTTIGQWVTDHYMGGPGIRSNTGPAWVGELFFNFGYAGVSLGMFLMGMYFRLLHEKLCSPTATIPAVWLSVIFVYVTVPTMGGGLVGPVNAIGYYGGMVLVIHAIVRTLSGTSIPGTSRGWRPDSPATRVA